MGTRGSEQPLLGGEQVHTTGGRRRPGAIDDGDDVAELTRALLDEVRDEVGRADAKASSVLTAAGIALGAMLGGFIYGAFAFAGQPVAVVAGLVGGMGLVFVGVALLAAVIFPSSSRPVPGRARYFEDIAVYERPDGDLARALEAEAADLEARAREQLLALSRIVRRKYRVMRASAWCLGSGFLVVIAAALSASFD